MKRFNGTIFITLFSLIVLFPVPLYAAGLKTVVFDEAHGQKFLIERKGPLDLSKLAAIFQSEGLRVKTNKDEITQDILSDIDALVISGAFHPFSPTEINDIIRFIERGGRLSVMLHIGFPLADLLHRMNVSISTGVLHEQENKIQGSDLNFYVREFKSQELLQGLDRFSIFGAWALLNTRENAEIIAWTSSKAWVDLNRNNKIDKNDAVQSFGVVILGNLKNGSFVVFGDDAVFQNRFFSEENVMLGRNLAQWLKGASIKKNPSSEN